VPKDGDSDYSGDSDEEKGNAGLDLSILKKSDRHYRVFPLSHVLTTQKMIHLICWSELFFIGDDGIIKLMDMLSEKDTATRSSIINQAHARGYFGHYHSRN
jgi:hypothetical protein